MYLSNTEYDKLFNKWSRIINSVENKTEFEATFLDKIHLYKTDSPNAKTIDVKRLKGMNFYDDIDDLEYILDVAIQEQKKDIVSIDVVIDVEAVMCIAIPAVKHYLKAFNK